MIFDPARHETLDAPAWDAELARACIHDIVAGAEDAFLEGRGWRLHPADHDDRDLVLGALYLGNTGIVWALDTLQARGAAALRCDYRAFLATPQLTHEKEPASWLFGEPPLLMLRHGWTGEAALADRIAALAAGNLRHPSKELMWGAPGSQLSALFMHRRTGEDRWAALFREAAQVLESQLSWAGDPGCHYWQQDLYGRTGSFVDSVHGFAGNAHVLLQGRGLLPAGEWERWQALIARTVRAVARWEDGLVNWRTHVLQAEERVLVQYCHGAPGFVICLADWPDGTLDDLLLAAGETTWRAGPLKKGTNLCHGTGGNGYAFLKLHERFGEERWLDRARAFAMHGIAQVRRDREQHGQWRHGLWTGDLGFALYLVDCIEATGRFPTLDVFDVAAAA